MPKEPAPKLADLLAVALRRKHAELRSRLGIPEELNIDGLELESLAYHLGERSGAAYVKLEGDRLRVGESETANGIEYRGDAARILLKTWEISLEEAKRGIHVNVKDGRRIVS